MMSSVQGFDVKFDMHEAYSPFKQLLLIFPCDSSALLPEPYRNLVLDTSSILRSPIDYYPTSFDIDPNGAGALYNLFLKLIFEGF